MTQGLRPCGDDRSDESRRSRHWERFAIYMHMTGSDDSGTDIAEEGSSIDTTSESEAFH